MQGHIHEVREFVTWNQNEPAGTCTLIQRIKSFLSLHAVFFKVCSTARCRGPGQRSTHSIYQIKPWRHKYLTAHPLSLSEACTCLQGMYNDYHKKYRDVNLRPGIHSVKPILAPLHFTPHHRIAQHIKMPLQRGLIINNDKHPPEMLMVRGM